LFDNADPMSASNRRISIIVMNRDAEDRLFRTAPELAQTLAGEERSTMPAARGASSPLPAGQ
jgi:chemotaxis protein MotB